MERSFVDETTEELRRRLEGIETEAIKIRREISRRDREEITRLQSQLEQLRIRESVETVEAVPVQPVIPVLLRDNRTSGCVTTRNRNRDSRRLIEYGETTELIDVEGTEILSGQTVQLLTQSSKNSPFRKDKQAIAIGVSHFGDRLWIGRVRNTEERTDRQSKNVKVIRN